MPITLSHCEFQSYSRPVAERLINGKRGGGPGSLPTLKHLHHWDGGWGGGGGCPDPMPPIKVNVLV